MQASQLQPAGAFAQLYGAKVIVFGGPGLGKTPIINTAPRPILCVMEPGMLSMKGSNVPTWGAFTGATIKEFFDWFEGSKEAANFDTLCIDSISQMAEIFLREEMPKHKDPRKAYGEMSNKVMDILNKIFYMKNKHVYMIAKQANVDEGGVQVLKPYFPGQDLNVKVPHMFDVILHIEKANIPGVPEPQVALRSKSTFSIFARDRSGKLAELEPPNLTNLFNKIMS